MLWCEVVDLKANWLGGRIGSKAEVGSDADADADADGVV